MLHYAFLDVPVSPEPAALALVMDRIVEVVEERRGIKETDLAIEIINDLSDHFMCDEITTATILSQIQRAVREGRITGIDCQMGEHGCTYLFPTGTQIRTMVPIEDRRTRH